MARVIIEGIPVLSFDVEPRQKYWGAMSQYISNKYGYKKFTEAGEVEAILLSCFDFLVTEFQNLLVTEEFLEFYQHVFWLNERSWELNLKLLGGAKLHTISRKDFAVYRRILKLILEQGCDAELKRGGKVNMREHLRIANKLQELLYVGTFLYEFSDHIAFQKMIEDCYTIGFDEHNMIEISWKYHYGFAYEKLFPLIQEDYVYGTFDETAVTELINKLNECFGITYNFAMGVIFNIQERHNPTNPELQTIEPYVLPINLKAQYGIAENDAIDFYEALTIRKSNKLPIEKAVYNPYSMNRYLYKPILVYNVEGVERALVGKGKVVESIGVLAINAMHWNKIHPEWLKNKCMSKFINSVAKSHDKVLEDKIEQIIRSKGLIFYRNIKSLRLLENKSVRIDNNTCGEIDFLVVNLVSNTIFVCEVKYNQSRNEAVGYRNDNSIFIDEYEPKLSKKLNWIKNNIEMLSQHVQLTQKISTLNLASFNVTAVFLINVPTFYMFNGDFKAIPLNQIDTYLDGKYPYPTVYANYIRPSGIEIRDEINHPYFRKP